MSQDDLGSSNVSRCLSPEAGDKTTNSIPLDKNKDTSRGKADQLFDYVSPHSSWSSSFNESAVEIILGLFREETRADAQLSYLADEDPAVREALILADAQDPDSWVSKTLANRKLWEYQDDGLRSGDESAKYAGIKRPRSASESKWNDSGEGKRLKGPRVGDL